MQLQTAFASTLFNEHLGLNFVSSLLFVNFQSIQADKYERNRIDFNFKSRCTYLLDIRMNDTYKKGDYLEFYALVVKLK